MEDGPAVGADELRHCRELAMALGELGDATIIVGPRRYPVLHYLMPAAENLVMVP